MFYIHNPLYKVSHSPYYNFTFTVLQLTKIQLTKIKYFYSKNDFS